MPYVRICPGCDEPFATARRDGVTCSSRCRVRIFRSEAHQLIRQEYERQDLNEADVAERAALQRLCPAIYKKRFSAQWTVRIGRPGRKRQVPMWRAPLLTAFLRQRYPQDRYPKETFTAFKARYLARDGGR